MACMKSRFAPLAIPLVAAALAACATDNGDNVFGPAFGPLDGGDSSSSSSSSGGGDPDAAPGDDGGAAEAGDDAGSSCATGTVAVLAGGASALSGAVQIKGGAWSGASIAGGAALSKPALVAFGQGFLGVTRGAGGALQSTSLSTTWSAASTFGVANVQGPPALAAAGTQAHVVYAAGVARDFHHGIHDGNAWNAATATVGMDPNRSVGTTGGGLAASGATVIFLENGFDNNKLYARAFDGAWQPSSEIAGAATVGPPNGPLLVGAEGKLDLVGVYVQQTTLRLSFATRDATTKAWTDRGIVHMLATTEEPFSVARAGTSTFLVAFRGQDGNGYLARGEADGNGVITWSAAAPIGGGGNVAVDSAPALARGVCGDDAIAVYASGGSVKATRLRGTIWTAAESVTGASGAFVAVATR